MLRALLIFILASPLTVRAELSAKVNILVLGDSLSAAYGIEREAGWVALLERHVDERFPTYKVVNASVSGETTGGGRARLPALLAEHRPRFVIIELGANDGLRGYPIPTVTANLEAMVALCKEANADVLLIGMHIPPNYGSKYTELFFRQYQEIAQNQKVELVPFLLEGVATDTAHMQADGLHPEANAQPVLLSNVLSRLQPLLEQAAKP